jgi:hypothetical protein
LISITSIGFAAACLASSTSSSIIDRPFYKRVIRSCTVPDRHSASPQPLSKYRGRIPHSQQNQAIVLWRHRTSIQNHIFNMFLANLSGISCISIAFLVYNPHRHSVLDRMIQETECIASRTVSFPLNENDTLLTPPLIVRAVNFAYPFTSTGIQLFFHSCHWKKIKSKIISCLVDAIRAFRNYATLATLVKAVRSTITFYQFSVQPKASSPSFKRKFTTFLVPPSSPLQISHFDQS